jgi:prepilin-type N-terminal cleavage/methylation domain-containing protein
LKKAFSLIELMIVIVIIGVVYTLAITKLKSVAEERVEPSFANLKEYLSDFITEDAKKATLMCLDDCSECGIYVDGVKTETIESFFDSSVEIYRYDFLQGAVRKRAEVYFNDENIQESVCFSFSVYKNNISEQVLVSYKERAYDYTTYFEKTPVYDSLQELLEAKEKLSQEVVR